MVLDLICYALSALFIAVFARIILSWFPMQPGSTMAQIYSFLFTVTEPIMGPIRRMIPPVGGLDISSLVVIIGIQVIQVVVLGCRVGIG